MLVLVSMLVVPAQAFGNPSVGVKAGDWIEYDIYVTGVGAAPPTHDVRWMRMDVLEVEGTAFWVNLTARYANGTVGSEVWEFNFTQGNLGGWLIIPANLCPGDMFYDSSLHNNKPVNVTVQGEEQRVLLGASRTITYGNDSLRHKEWDKATGVFVGSLEHYRNVTTKTGWYIEDLTVAIHATATNLWSQSVEEVSQNALYALVAVGIVIGVMAFSTLVYNGREKRFSVSPSWQKKIAVLTIVSVTLFGVATITMFPFYKVGMSFAEINLVMQTFWTGLVLLSMWFRIKGNYFVHQIMMLLVMCAWYVGFFAVLLMDPFSGGSAETLAGTPIRLVMNSLHGIFSIPALVFGTWLVALWRPASTTFGAKSRTLALLTTIFWVPSYVVGVLDFFVLHTTLFG